MPDIKVAVIQFSPQAEKKDNLSRAASLITDAARQGARLVVLPEMFSCVLPPDRWRACAEPAGGPVEEFLAASALEHCIYVVGGSFVEDAGDGRFYNTCPVLSPDGAVVGRYRKMHLFWTDIPGRTRYDERSLLDAGDSRFVFDADGFRIAVGICYDLRFPEFFRMPEGRPADLYCLGAAFMQATGQAHWETLVRARAIENLAFFAAAGTVGRHYDIHDRPGESVVTYGHSMVVSPWGETLASLGEGEGVAVAAVTREAIETARRRLGALDHIRSELWPQA